MNNTNYVNKLSDQAVRLELIELLDKLDELDQEDYLGTEGWRHYMGLEL